MYDRTNFHTACWYSYLVVMRRANENAEFRLLTPRQTILSISTYYRPVQLVRSLHSWVPAYLSMVSSFLPRYGSCYAMHVHTSEVAVVLRRAWCIGRGWWSSQDSVRAREGLPAASGPSLGKFVAEIDEATISICKCVYTVSNLAVQAGLPIHHLACGR